MKIKAKLAKSVLFLKGSSWRECFKIQVGPSSTLKTPNFLIFVTYTPERGPELSYLNDEQQELDVIKNEIQQKGVEFETVFYTIIKLKQQRMTSTHSSIITSLSKQDLFTKINSVALYIETKHFKSLVDLLVMYNGYHPLVNRTCTDSSQ